MNENVIIQIVLSVAGVLATVFATYKYIVGQVTKREKSFLEHIERMNQAQLEYNENKNGHMERMANQFTKAVDKNTKAINKLAVAQEKSKKK